MRYLSSLLIFSILLTGCTSTSQILSGNNGVDKRDFSEMYLRGIMNWWEASEPYMLQSSEIDTYALNIELIADGQPYDFKFADSAWTNELNCGFNFGEQNIRLDKKRELYCAGDSANIKFTPEQTGNYQFQLDVSDNSEPKIRIVKLD